MNETEFLAEFGFSPNIHELRIANFRDPIDESLPYDPGKYGGQTAEKYQRIWLVRGGKAEPTGSANDPQQPPATADNFPCSHRSTEVARIGICDLCSLKGKPFDVFACEIHGECSIGRKHSEVRSCVKCSDRDDSPRIVREPATKTLTIGMATFDDAARVRWTINSLREAHAKELRDAGYTWEIVVVNNNPVAGDDYSNHSRHLRIFNESSDPPVRVIDFGEQKGTFPPKAKVFDVARGEWVIVIDCHCLIRAGQLRQSLDWLTAHRNFNGLIHGVLVGDSGQRLYTHQEREYRDNMLAMWQNYDGPDANLPNNAKPSEFAEVKSVPQHGAFLFGCRRDAWPASRLPQGLHGFGGDENVDALFRSLGRKVVTLNWLEVWHDFIRLDQLYGYERKSSTAMFDRLRNDVLWCLASGETHRIVEALEHYQVPEAERVKILKEVGLWMPEGSKDKTHEDRSNLPRVSSSAATPERRREFRFTSRLGKTSGSAVRAG